MAKKEPEAVRRLFLDLYSDDGGDLKIRQEKIADFFRGSHLLKERLFPGSFHYKQDYHSVSGYLFLYDPDKHYMYKYTEAVLMADCVEFGDSWGSGEDIRLDVFYRMCDEMIEAINGCESLLNTDALRFDNRFRRGPEKLHPDTKKHILLFDIIY